MVFARADFPGLMSERKTRPLGYAFALPRLLARLGGRKVRRAQFSRCETYGSGLLVFGISCVFVGRVILPLVRPLPLQLLVLLLLPFVMWITWLLFFYFLSLLIALFRRLGLYSAGTNAPFQHVVIIALTTLLAVLLVRDAATWMQLLGALWIVLVALNLLSIALLQVLDGH
jgi:hypothetical protein